MANSQMDYLQKQMNKSGNSSFNVVDSTNSSSGSTSKSDINTNYQNYFNTAKPGESMDWAGGTLAMGEGGVATYTDAQGKTSTLAKDSDLNQIALDNPGIASEWYKTYGFTPTTPEETGNAGLVAPTDNTITGNTDDYEMPEGASVGQGILALANPDTDLAKRYITQGKQAANASGLLNSTMAGTAGYANYLDDVINIAGTDAETFAELYGQERQAELDSALSAQETAQQGWLYNVQGAISAELSKLDANQQMLLQTTLKNMDNAQAVRMAVLDEEIQTRLAEQEADINSRLMGEEAEYAIAQAREEANLERVTALAKIDAEQSWEQTLLDMKIDLEERTTLSADLNTIMDDYQKDRTEILVNPNFDTPEDRQAALTQLEEIAQYRVGLLAANYPDVEIDWSVEKELLPGVEDDSGKTLEDYQSELESLERKLKEMTKPKESPTR